MRKLFVLGCVMLLTIGLLVTGCKKKSEEEHMDHEHAHEKSADVLPAGANLMCPVMPDEKALGSLYVEFNGKKIYVCCKKCLNRVKDDPALWYTKAYGDKDKH